MATRWATNVLRCLDCGKCTSVCPVARYNHALSPRRIVRSTAGGNSTGARVAGGGAIAAGEPSTPAGPGALASGPNGAGANAVWSCLTCMYCDTRCPQEVSITRIMPKARATAREAGDKPPFTRCGAMESIAAIQSQAAIPQNRLDWVPKDVKVDPKSKTVLWVGCTPYFDAFYAENGVKTLEAVTSAIRILNAMGVTPALLKDERCCGHDALWGGDHETFEKLAAMNVAMFERVKPELVLTVCPECSLTLGREYKERFGVPGCRVQHIAEYIAEHAAELALASRPQKVTFEDPCRLGRHQGKYDEPRQALATVPGLELREMFHSRARATCCSGNWLSCNAATKRIQTDLLKEAQATGSELLVTACPKCMIHLKCAQAGDANVPDLEIRDLAVVVAGALAGKDGSGAATAGSKAKTSRKASNSSPKERG